MITEVSSNQSGVLASLVLQGEQRLRQNDMAIQPIGDVISISKPEEMTDEEIEQTLAAVHDYVAANKAEALSVHSGLDYDRVMYLLSDPMLPA